MLAACSAADPTPERALGHVGQRDLSSAPTLAGTTHAQAVGGPAAFVGDADGDGADDVLLSGRDWIAVTAYAADPC